MATGSSNDDVTRRRFPPSAAAGTSTGDGDDPRPSQSSAGASANDNPDSTHADGAFECNICLDTAKDAVVSMCGHLFW